MIVGVDHVALSCDDVRAAGRELEAAGLQIKFTQEGAVNHELKRPLLKEYESVHSIAYCQSPGGVALELTQHSAPLAEATSPYQVLLSVALPNSVPVPAANEEWASIWEASFECRQPEAAFCSTLRAQFWHDVQFREAAPPRVRGVLVPVSDVERSQHFWCRGLGFTAVSAGSVAGRGWALVSRKTPVPNWSLDVVLAESEGVRPAPLLDDAGFPCLALLSTALGPDTEKLCRAGGQLAAGEFQVEVNGKLLGITLVRGPDRELIELIAVRAASR